MPLRKTAAGIVGEAHARTGRDGDAVDGVPVEVVAAPAGTAEVAELLRHACAEGLTVVARGAGTMLGWGAPPDRSVDLLLDLSRLDGTLEHAAGDLVVRVSAGVRLGPLGERLAVAGQRFALDPPESSATVGGVIAASPSGPLRHRYGTVRDLLLGVTVVLADGTVATAGGKVVKNVAGYDLGRLYSGSFGTLGIVVEAVLRLHPLPAAQRVVMLPATDPARVADLAARLGAAQLVPSAVEYDSAAGCVAVLIEGPAGAVDAQATQVAVFGDGAAVGADLPDWWRRHPWQDPRADGARIGLTVAYAPTSLPALLAALPAGTRTRGRVAAGVLEVAVPLAPAPADLRALLERLRAAVAPGGGSVVVRSAPPALKRQVDVWGDPGDALELMRRVKARFDPGGVLSPGRFVGGI